MPWKKSTQRQRLDFVLLALRSGSNLRALCRQFAISAPTGYKWIERYKTAGIGGLAALPPVPGKSPRDFCPQWHREVIALRRKHPTWGVRKLRILLRGNHPRVARLPALRTMGRWLRQTGQSAPRRPRSRPGPQVERPALSVPVGANDVWTIDFKGWFRTSDGQRCDPLTVRDLASRFLLCASILANQSDERVRRVMTGLFRRFGLPRVIRVDNGVPFAGQGSLNLTRLSVWWLRLGIRVEFTRPGKPQDNGAHEQMHRVLKADTASPPAANPKAQQRRLDRWRGEYNTLRPHEGLDYGLPADLYAPSPRRFHVPAPPTYPEHWLSRKVRPNGWVKFRGVLRFIGRAFARQLVGLEAFIDLSGQEASKVYLDDRLIGTLHRCDANGAMRHAMFRTPKKTAAKTAKNPSEPNPPSTQMCK